MRVHCKAVSLDPFPCIYPCKERKGVRERAQNPTGGLLISSLTPWFSGSYTSGAIDRPVASYCTKDLSELSLSDTCANVSICSSIEEGEKEGVKGRERIYQLLNDAREGIRGTHLNMYSIQSRLISHREGGSGCKPSGISTKRQGRSLGGATGAPVSKSRDTEVMRMREKVLTRRLLLQERYNSSIDVRHDMPQPKRHQKRDGESESSESLAKREEKGSAQWKQLLRVRLR